MSEQLEIDFSKPQDPLELLWAERCRANAHLWTDEALCILWACGGYDDRDWWNGLHSYERRAWLLRYQTRRADALERGVALKPAGYVLMEEEEHYRQSRSLAERWAQDLRAAFLTGQPCPIKAEPAYQWILEWAFRLSQVNPASLKTT